MKKIGLVIVIGLISSIVYGQTFETNLSISQALTFKSSRNTENKLALGYSGSIQELYNLTDNFAIGTALIYSLENYKCTIDYTGVSIPESTSYYESKLTVNSVKIPLILRLKLKSDWLVSVGYGLTYSIDDKVSVNYYYYDWFSKDKTQTEIYDKSLVSENNLSSYYSIGFGRTFKIKDLHLLTEIYYNRSFADYRIEHGGINETEIRYFYNISPQYLGLRIGLGL